MSFRRYFLDRSRRQWKNYHAVFHVPILAQFLCVINLFKGIMVNCRLLMMKAKAYLFSIYSGFIPDLFEVYSHLFTIYS